MTRAERLAVLARRYSISMREAAAMLSLDDAFTRGVIRAESEGEILSVCEYYEHLAHE